MVWSIIFELLEVEEISEEGLNALVILVTLLCQDTERVEEKKKRKCSTSRM